MLNEMLKFKSLFSLLVLLTEVVRLCCRLEQPHLNANASFFEALSCCSRLQRLCLISRSGTFDPSATESFMERCRQVIMCHMFMNGTLVTCRTLQKALLVRSALFDLKQADFKYQLELISDLIVVFSSC